jgi:hypothetical protein
VVGGKMETDTFIIHHGSNCEIKRGDLLMSREDIDFGRGFYLTKDKRMAEKWAAIKSNSVVSTYRMDLSGLNVYEFGLNKEWLEFVKANRTLESNSDILKRFENYDILIGPTADDTLFTTVQEYIDGQVSSSQAIKYLDVAGYSNQIVLKTEEALDQCNFLSSRTIIGFQKQNIRKFIQIERRETLDKLAKMKEKDAKMKERQDEYERVE